MITSRLPGGSYLVLAHPASDVHPAEMAEMTRRVNQRMSGPKATKRDRAMITRFFDGLELLEPGVVQPQQWRPGPGALGPPQVIAWCGIARKRWAGGGALRSPASVAGPATVVTSSDRRRAAITAGLSRALPRSGFRRG